VVGELLDQAARDRKSQQGSAVGDGADRRDELVAGPPLSSNPLAPARSSS
jgi:hypothetical protein